MKWDGWTNTRMCGDRDVCEPFVAMLTIFYMFISFHCMTYTWWVKPTMVVVLLKSLPIKELGVTTPIHKAAFEDEEKRIVYISCSIIHFIALFLRSLRHTIIFFSFLFHYRGSTMIYHQHKPYCCCVALCIWARCSSKRICIKFGYYFVILIFTA